MTKLTPRQLLTIEHLNYKEEKTPEEIIAFCIKKIKQTRIHKAGGRRHSKQYFRDILYYYRDVVVEKQTESDIK